MRISDWSSDVCSSDLPGRPRQVEQRVHARRRSRPGAGADRRRARGLGQRRADGVPGPAGRPDRPHRDRARPALEPLWFGSDRRRDPDLHPPRRDRKSTRLNSVTNAHLVCRLLLEKKKKENKIKNKKKKYDKKLENHNITLTAKDI